MEEFLLKNGFFVRPRASDGLWTLVLLPLSILSSFLRHPVVLTKTYKLVAVLSIGLLATSVGIIIVCIKKLELRTLTLWSLAISLAIACCFNVFLDKGWIFSVASGIFSSLIFLKILKLLLSVFKECFTIGEAGIIAQGFVIFVFCMIENTMRLASSNIVPRSNMQTYTVIIQIGITSIILLAFTAYQLNASTVKLFYFTTGFVLIFSMVLPLQIILAKNPVVFIFNQILTDIGLLKLIIFWSFCSGIATLAILYQVNTAKKASSSTRKIFHVLAVFVYTPGLISECSFLYLASGVVLGIFFFLEIIRIMCVPPLGPSLQDSYIVFSDEKDSGILALTPIYLLVGCSLPLWLHPAPCDVTDSAMFNILPVLSGLLSIGIGDTFASVIGSYYGKLKWGGTKKTIEGTLACIVSQLAFVYVLHILGLMPNISDEQILRLTIAVFVVAVVEAKTDQIDNLVLPLVMYILLI